MAHKTVYSRLVKLYRTNGVKTPMEDFCTEILAGILAGSQLLGDAFAIIVLRLEGEKFTYSTQEIYRSSDPKYTDSRVDMVVRSEEVICFVEHKVESREGYVQLEKYAATLNAFQPGLRTYLKYCTKYYDQKNFELHNFHQFRWADVYRFLSNWQGTGVIDEFLTFLKEHDMSDEMDFTLADLMALQGISAVVGKMDRYLPRIKAIWGNYFDTARMKDSSNLHQIKANSRYIFHLAEVFGSLSYSEVGAGFDFTDVPQLKVWVWTNAKNSKSSDFRAIIQSADFNLGFGHNGNDWMGIAKPLSDFISSENMKRDIENWFAEIFKKLSEFVEAHPGLEWHIRKVEKV